MVRVRSANGLGVNGLREWKGPRVASRDPRVIKTVSAQRKGQLVVKQYALEVLVAKSQLRVKVNKIGPRASGLDPHRMRKCPRPLGEGPSVSLV